MDHVARNGRNPQPVPISTPHGGTSSESARLINPAAPPASLPGKAAGPSDAAGKADAYSRKSGTAGPSGQGRQAGYDCRPSGQLAATGSEPGSLALPPAEMPAVPAIQRGAALVSGSEGGKAVSTPSAAGALGAPGGASSGASGNTAVQVPALPSSDLALPPEHRACRHGRALRQCKRAAVSRENVATQQPASLKTVACPKPEKAKRAHTRRHCRRRFPAARPRALRAFGNFCSSIRRPLRGQCRILDWRMPVCAGQGAGGSGSVSEGQR